MTKKIEFFNIDTMSENLELDVLFTCEYGRLCELSDDAEWEICCYKDLVYVYLKRPYKFEGIIYYDLISPYGYNGFQYKNPYTFEEFITLFRKEAKKRNYITEVIRQAPYLNTDTSVIKNVYDIMTNRKIFSIKIDTSFEDYKKALPRDKRNKITKSIKLGFFYKVFNIEKNTLTVLEPIWDRFKILYHNTMDSVNASDYYYFNDEYFDSFMKFKNAYLFVIYNNEEIEIGYSIVMKSYHHAHYHLSCSDKSESCISEYILYSIMNEFCLSSEKKELILGGGLKDNDSLYIFKDRISNRSYDYIMYKNILNDDIYNKINQNSEEIYFPIHRKGCK